MAVLHNAGMVSSVHASLPTEPAPAAAGLLRAVQRPDQCRVHVHDYLAVGVGSLPAAKRATGDRRAERALLMAAPGDVVVLAGPPDAGYLDYLNGLGLGPRRQDLVFLGRQRRDRTSSFADLGRDARLTECLAAEVAARVDDARQLRLTTYYWSRRLDDLRRGLEHHLGRTVIADAGCEHAVVLANRKDWTRAEALRLGIPVAPGLVLGSSQFGDVAAALHEGVIRATRQQCEKTGGAVIRGAWSTSGADVRIERSPADLDALGAWLEARPHVDVYLVEEYLPLCASPNVQLWIGDGGDVSLAGMFDQRISAAGTHFGNAHPYLSPYTLDMEQASVALAQALAGYGYRGPLGLDLIERADGSGFALAEANGRMNASSYACTLFESINRERGAAGLPPLTAWLSHVEVPVGAAHFADVARRLGELLYTHDTAAGIVPYNTGLLGTGTLDLLVVAADPAQAASLERRALARLR